VVRLQLHASSTDCHDEEDVLLSLGQLGLPPLQELSLRILALILVLGSAPVKDLLALLAKDVRVGPQQEECHHPWVVGPYAAVQLEAVHG
jgi:hypothetical protein